MIPAIFGLAGLTIDDRERGFFRECDPAGYILFGRNIGDPAQLRKLTDALRDLAGRDDLPILIDQEGGRVARMRAPMWPDFPAGGAFDALYARAPSTAIAAARANAMAIARMLADVGITVDCLPLLDVAQPGATDAIGDRALGSDPMQVAALGRAVIEGLHAGGVVSVIKHLPGHGRASVDSHLSLPRVSASADELEIDLAPFRTLASAPMGMSSHIVYDAWDPDLPATLSPTVIADVIRGRIGFDGLLLTDDLDMKALSGSVPDNAARAVAAGCDIALNCWAKMDDMAGIAEQLTTISDASRARLDAAMAVVRGRALTDDVATLAARRDALFAAAA